jgi:hypothetical protein
MMELLLLIGLAVLLRNWLQAPTQQDCEDWIVVNEFQVDDHDSL